jgi:hypothetical protein
LRSAISSTLPICPSYFGGLRVSRQIATQWTDAYDEFGAEVYEYIDADPWVVCDIRWYGKGKGSNLPTDIHVADTFEVEDGKIVRAILSYRDVRAALKAVAPGS